MHVARIETSGCWLQNLGKTFCEPCIAAKRRHGHVSQAILDKITRALATRGVELVPQSESAGSGVRWIAPRERRPKEATRSV